MNFGTKKVLIPASLVFLLLLSSVAYGVTGEVDLSFDPGSFVDGWVRTVAVQEDGKVLIGGDFTTVRGEVRPHIARLNSDGTLDGSFNPGDGADGTGFPSVFAIAIQVNGQVIVG